MHAFFWLAWRALTKLGIAIAARRPMMATTIMISTSVKPAFRLVLLMFILFYLRCEQDQWRVINEFICFVHRLPLINRIFTFSNRNATVNLENYYKKSVESA